MLCYRDSLFPREHLNPMPRLDFLSRANADYVNDLYEQWRREP